MNKESHTIRDYKPDDDPQLVALHNEIFHSDITIKDWLWKYHKQPQGRPWISVAEINGEIVGQQGVIHNHLNFTGREVVVGQAGDSLVRADQRGKGMFVKLGHRNYGLARNNGVAAVFNFPNLASYPGYVRRLGWTRVCNLKYYWYRVGYRKMWGSGVDRLYKLIHSAFLKAKHAAMRSIYVELKELKFSRLSNLPEEFERTLKETRDHEVLSIWKDMAYLKWRYENHPSRRYAFHFLYIDEQPEALIVVRDLGDAIAICDVMHRTKNIRHLAALLSSVIRHYGRSKAQKIEFFGHDDGCFDAVFGACHFKRQPTSAIMFGGVVLDESFRDVFASPHNWTISYGDVDPYVI